MSSPRADGTPPGATRPVVWLGAAGTGTAFGLAKTLREHFGEGVGIIAADINPPELVATSLLADRFVRMPPSADSGFAEALVGGLAETGATHYLPLLDEEISSAALAREEGGLPGGLTVMAPPLKSARTALDKLAAAEWFVAHDLPTPPTKRPSEWQWTGAPLFAKPRCGRGSIGARTIDDEAALLALGGDGSEDLIVQPRCEGPEVTVDAVVLDEGVRAVCRERLEVKSGVCTKARVFEDPALEDLAGRIASGLGLSDVFCFQVMRLEGAWVVTDLNARPGAGTRLTVAAGVDVLGAMFHRRFGLPYAHLVGRLPAERIVVRQYAEFVTR